MQELITRLTEKAGISAEQATKTIETIKEFVKEKFPMLGGAVDNMFAGSADNATSAAVPVAGAPKAEEHSMLDKISDVIPGQAGEKIEDFAKKASDKAEDVFDSVTDKLSGMFGGDKK
ncbi:MAG: hypothetical protein IPI88_16220 [Chitinophagaceae bacterium]|nr:hypothetical protein [Chitinophagaceae bacterium]